MTFSCAPSGGAPAGALPAQAVEHRGRDVGQHVAADGDVLAAARVGEAHRDAVGARLDRGDLGAAAQLAPAAARRRLERGGDRAHAADGHVPVAGAVADDVVEEAAVLAQVGVVGAGERPDERVGERDAAHGVVVEAVLDELAERALDERRPRRVVADARAQLGSPGAAARSASGKSARGGAAHVAYSRSQPSIAAGSPVAACSDAAVRSRSSASTSRPRDGVGGQRRVGGDPPPAQPERRPSSSTIAAAAG